MLRKQTVELHVTGLRPIYLFSLIFLMCLAMKYCRMMIAFKKYQTSLFCSTLFQEYKNKYSSYRQHFQLFYLFIAIKFWQQKLLSIKFKPDSKCEIYTVKLNEPMFQLYEIAAGV